MKTLKTIIGIILLGILAVLFLAMVVVYSPILLIVGIIYVLTEPYNIVQSWIFDCIDAAIDVLDWIFDCIDAAIDLLDDVRKKFTSKK